MNTNKKKQTSKKFLEKLRWYSVFFIPIVTMLGNYYYKNIHYIIRLSIILPLLITSIILFFFTSNGKSTIFFILQSKAEAKKVFWPSSQETFHTTLIIAVITIIMSLIFWGLDTFLVLFISFCTNLRF